MANDYYEATFAGQEYGLARAEDVVAALNAVESAFDKLPRLRALLEDRVTSAVATTTDAGQSYRITVPHPPTAYTRGMAVQVGFPATNKANPTLNLVAANGTALGAKSIRQVNGQSLGAGHIEENAIAELYYQTADGGYWILGAGAAGVEGPPGPPEGTFSLNSSSELIFTPNTGSIANFGPIAPRWQGAYSSGTEYDFMDLVRSGTGLYLYISTTASTGTAVTDTTVWQRLANAGAPGGMVTEFRTATSQSDPGDGRMRFNNSSLSSVTRIYVDDQDADGNDLSDWIDTWDDYGSSPHAQLLVQNADGGTVAVFGVTDVAALSGYRRITVTHVAGSTRPDNDDLVTLVPLLRGNTGSQGNDGNDATVTDDTVLDLAQSSRSSSDRGKLLGTSETNENALALVDKPTGRERLYTPGSDGEWSNNSTMSFSVALDSGKDLDDHEYITISLWAGASDTNKFNETITILRSEIETDTDPSTTGDTVHIGGVPSSSNAVVFGRNNAGTTMYFRATQSSYDTGKIMGIWGGDF